MLQLDRISYALRDGRGDASFPRSILSNVSLSVRPGERVALVGRNGCGKSTLARIVMGDLAPDAGELRLDERPYGELTQVELVRQVGYVGQDPLAQIVSSTVFDEVAFGPRNLMLAREEVCERVERALASCGLAGFERRDVHALSGGEQQRLALAGVLAMGCSYLVLDEVTSHLDAASRVHLREVIDELQASGVGVLEITHRAEDLAGASRVLALEDGHVQTLVEGDPAAPSDQAQRAAATEALAPWVYGSPAGASAEERAWLEQLPSASREGGDALSSAAADASGDVSAPANAAGLVLSHVTVGYGGPAVVSDRSAQFAFGEVTLVVGPSGSGKSTLAHVATGVLAPQAGEVLLAGVPVVPGMVGLSFQRPDDQLFCNTVAEELAYAPRNQGLDEDAICECVSRARTAVGLGSELLDVSPFELSGGEQRRVAIAATIAGNPRAYVFDEPTASLDLAGIEAMRTIVRALADEGAAVLVVTHEPAQWRGVADAVLMLDASRRDADEGIAPRASSAASGPGALVAGASTSSAQSSTSQRLLGAYQPKRSWLHDVDPLAKLIVLYALSMVVFFLEGPALIAGLVLSLVLMASIRMSARSLAQALRPTIIVLAVSLLGNSFVINGAYDLQLIGTVGLSYTGLVRGLRAVVRIIGALGYLLVLIATTTPPELADAVARLLSPLAALGIPVTDVSVTFALVLRLIPETITTFKRIETAQRARGTRFDEGGIVQRLRRWIAVLLPLIVELFSRADDIARAMRARAYTGHGMTAMHH